MVTCFLPLSIFFLFQVMDKKYEFETRHDWKQLAFEKVRQYAFRINFVTTEFSEAKKACDCNLNFSSCGKKYELITITSRLETTCV